MGRVEGKVAFITGAARGQGRNNAVALAREGADIIAVDICGPIATVPFPHATPEDLEETVRQVQATGRRIVATTADVRDYATLKAALDAGVDQLGRLDIVLANAGIVSFGPAHELTDEAWSAVIDIDLTGVWHTSKAATPHLIEGGRGGSMILTSSAAGLKGHFNIAHYNSAKHGVIGLMKALVVELSAHMIRVNCLCPTTVLTPMVENEAMFRLFLPDLEHPTLEDFAPAATSINAMPVPWVEMSDIANAVLFLASEDSRYITGVALPIDAGYQHKVAG